MCMFGFPLGDCKNMFKPKVTIEFLLTKRFLDPNILLQRKTKYAQVPFL